MPRRTLGQTGLSLTEFSFGCAGIGGLFRACPEDQATATLNAAWQAGIRAFDTAPFYGTGLSEQRLGAFLAGKPRDQVAVSTKAGRLLTPVAPDAAPDYGFVGGLPAQVTFDYSGDGIAASVQASLTRLGLERIDILYVHDIGTYAHGADNAARHMADLTATGFAALERLKQQGVIRAWGLGVNETTVCLEVMRRAQPDVILLAGRYTLLDRSAEADLLPMCRARDVPLVIGGVFNSGILATGAVRGAQFNYAPALPAVMNRVQAMQRICTAADTTLLTAALRFPLVEPAVASVLLGNADPIALAQNLQAARQPVDARVFRDTRPFALTTGIPPV